MVSQSSRQFGLNFHPPLPNAISAAGQEADQIHTGVLADTAKAEAVDQTHTGVRVDTAKAATGVRARIAMSEVGGQEATAIPINVDPFPSVRAAVRDNPALVARVRVRQQREALDVDHGQADQETTASIRGQADKGHGLKPINRQYPDPRHHQNRKKRRFRHHRPLCQHLSR